MADKFQLDKILKDCESRFPERLEQLKSLSRIPSISFDGFPPGEVERSASAVAELLSSEGMDNVEVIRIPNTHPYVYAEWLKAPGKPTVLLYAHHDVQPVGDESKWKSPPFEPTERDGRLYGRGTADDKAGIMVHVAAIGSFLKVAGALPINVKVLIEGEEEIGSAGLETFLRKYRQKVQADVIVLTDTDNYDVGIPSITTSLRGLVATEVEVRVMESSKHSGMWGGPLVDPIIALSKMIASLVDEEGRMKIPGIYDEVIPPSPAEMKSFQSLGYSEEQFRHRAGVVKGLKIWGGNKHSITEKVWRLPSLSCNAIVASSRKGCANIINDSAWCKIGIRTVPNMNGARTLDLLTNYLKANAPWGVEVTFKPDPIAPWWQADAEAPAFSKAQKALTRAFGANAVFIGNGGTIPFVHPFTRELGGVPALLIGVEDPYTNAHSENESLHLAEFRKSMLGAVHLYEELSHGLK